MSLEARRAIWAQPDRGEPDTPGRSRLPEPAGRREPAVVPMPAEVSRRSGALHAPGGTDYSRTPDPDSGSIDPVRRTKIRHLARDSRMPTWRSRLLIAAAVGIAMTILTNWRWGLTLAVVTAIVDAVIRSRASAVSSAEGLTTSAQRRTKRELARLERSGYRSLHIRAIPDSDEVIDHLLIGPTGVYAIDSELWDRRLPVRTKSAKQLWHGPYSQKDRLEHARWEAMQASQLLTNALGESIAVQVAGAV
jgi:Nuclease-related domain